MRSLWLSRFISFISRFDKAVSFLTVKEDVPIGTSIGYVTARDDDSGENAKITYSLERLQNIFSLNTSTGKPASHKALKQTWDRAFQKSYPKLLNVTVGRVFLQGKFRVGWDSILEVKYFPKKRALPHGKDLKCFTLSIGKYREKKPQMDKFSRSNFL